jgi:hypothetical protein
MADIPIAAHLVLVQHRVRPMVILASLLALFRLAQNT